MGRTSGQPEQARTESHEPGEGEQWAIDSDGWFKLTQLTVRCLGGLEIRLDDRQITGFESHKVEALFCYLAMRRGRGFTREHLAALLWPEKPGDAARRNLRQVIYNLKTVLAASGSSPILAQGRELRFDPAFACWLDVEAFSEARRRGLSKGAIAPHHLAQAVAFYRGDFLAGFALKDSPEFEFWQLAEQERLREQAIDTLTTLIESYLSRGEFRLGIQYARRLVGLDPLSEQARRYLMQLYSLSGRRSRALAEYEHLREALRRELAVDPLETTRELYEAILTEQESAPREEDRQGIGPLIPLVGRQQSYQELRNSWESVLENGARLTLVEGEPGIGKTRIVKSFLDATSSQRLITILKGRCSERVPTAYQPFAQILRNAISEDEQRAHTALRAAPQDLLSDLALLVPDLTELLPKLTPKLSSGPTLEKTRLFGLIADFLAQFCRRPEGEPLDEPLVLLLSNLQWARRETVELIDFLLERLASLPIWILGCCCPTGFGGEPPILQKRDPGSRDGRVTQIVLGRLSAESIEELAAALVDDEEAGALARFLTQRSHGLPIAVAEWINSLWDEEALVHEAGRWRLQKNLTEFDGDLSDVVCQRLRRLPTSTRRLAAQAAVVGQLFDARLLQQAAGEHPKVVEVGLELMLERWLIRQHSDHWMSGRRERDIVLWAKGAKLGGFEFNHQLIWQTILDDVNPLRQQIMHTEVARALEAGLENDTERFSEALAFHYGSGCQWEETIAHLRPAIRTACTLQATDTASYYLRQAIGVLDKLIAADCEPGDEQAWQGERERMKERLAETRSSPLELISS